MGEDGDDVFNGRRGRARFSNCRECARPPVRGIEGLPSS